MTRLLVHWGGESHRSEGLALALGAELAYLGAGRGGPLAAALRYGRARRATFALLERRRPSLLVVPSLPLPLPMTALAWAARSGAAVVIDGHTGAFRGKWWARARPLVRSLCRRATLVIAHNRTDEATLAGWRARTLLLPDVTHPLAAADGAAPPPRSVAYVTSFGADDPLDAVFAAAALLPDVAFAVTGRPPPGLRPPANVRLTGFLHRADYLALLAHSGLVAALTRTPDLMQIAADEALCLGRPAVVSDSPVLREVLGGAAAYCDNSPQGFADALRPVLDAPEGWRRAAEAQREARMRNLAAQVAAMAALLRASGYNDSCPTRSCA